MASGKISYNAAQHRELEAELDKIGDNFKDLITDLDKLKSSVSNNLKGKAATSLSTELSSLLGKLKTEKENWSTVKANAKKVEQLLKEADENAGGGFSGGGGYGGGGAF